MFKKSLVNNLLVLNSFRLDLLLWGGFVEKVSLGFLVLVGLFSGKVGNVEFGNVNFVNVNLGRSGNDVLGVDPSKWNTVHFERTRNQEGVVLKVVKVYNSLSSETTSQKNQHGSWGDGRSKLLWASGLSRLLLDRNVLSWVPFWGLKLVSSVDFKVVLSLTATIFNMCFVD